MTYEMISIFLILCTASIATAQNVSNDFNLLSAVFSSADVSLLDLPFPYSFGSMETVASRKPTYARFIASKKGIDATSVIRQTSDHSEYRTDKRARLVVWTRMNMVDRVSEILCSSIQQFLLNALNSSNANKVSGLPSGLELLEFELITVPGEEWIKRPLCTRIGVPGLRPCPTLLFMDSTLVSGFGSYGIIVPLTKYLSSAPMPIADIAQLDRSDYFDNDSLVRHDFCQL